MANKEIYRLSINVGVNGDAEAKKKITSLESVTEKIEKKLKNLSQLTASPTSKIKDLTTPIVEKIESKAKKLNSTSISPTAKIKDNASSNLDRIDSKIGKLDKKESKSRITIQDEATKSLSNIQNKINSFIKSGAKKIISLGLAGITAAGGLGIGTSIKTYSEYEKGLSNVKAVTGATASEMKQLDASAKQLGSTTAWSARHVTQAEELLGQAGFSVNETITALPGLLNLASAGDLDLASATDIASGTLRAFNLNANQSSHVADVLALSASATNSDVTDLGETMKYVAPVSQALGISLEDTAAASGLLSNANIKGSQAGTVLRQTMARLASPTTEAAKVMKKYGINAFDAHGNMKPLSSVVDNLNSSLGKLTSQQRADVISTIFGTESMSGVLALMNQGGKSVSDLSKQLKDANGASQKMADTKLDNLNGQWIKLKAAVEHMQITLGEKLAPYAKQFVTWLTGKMPELTEGVVSMVDYVSKHTEEIKSLATTVIGLSAAFVGLSAVGKFGNTLAGISSVVSILKGANVAEETTEIVGALSKVGIIGKLLPAIFTPAGIAVAASVGLIGTAVIANNSLMQKSCTTTVEELGPVEKIMNKLNGNINKSKSELIAAGLIYDDFGDNVSDNFKKAAQDASKSLLKIEMDINRLTSDGNFSANDNNSMKNYVNNMAYEAINAMRGKQSEIKSEFEKTFSLDGVISNAEQGVMDYLSSYFDEGVNKELSIRDEIYKIGDKAIKDHGSLLDGDMQQIKEKLAELQAIKLEYANAENAGERAYSQSKFKSAAERVTGIDGASELLKERTKEHQNAIDETNANYDKTIATTKELMKTAKTDDDKSKLQKGLDEVTAARDKALKQAEDDWQSDLNTLYDTYPKAKGLLNENTGEKFSDKDIKRNQTLDNMTSEKYAGLTDVKESGMYSLIDNDTGKYESVYAEVDKVTGKVVGAYATATGEVGGYTAEMADNAKKSALDISNSNFQITSTLNTVKSASVNAASEMVGDNDRLITKLGELQTAQDGTLYRTMNINGTPINVQVDSSGAILNLDEVRQKAEEASKGKTIDISSNANQATSEIDGTSQALNEVPPETPADISSNANEATGEVNGTTTAINNMPESKTITITTIFKKITQWIEEKLGGGDSYNNQSADNYTNPDTGVYHDTNGDGFPDYATGTDYAAAGLATANEKGWELSDRTTPIIGQYNDNPVVNLQRGTKIKNHMDSMSEMKADVKQEVANQMPQQKVQVYQPQLAVAGGGNSFSFSMGGININNIADKAAIVKQATQEFAKQFMEVLNNQA